ncbi:MAG: hypothetical protein Q9198_010855 [Flavoplaca austrocitrina]
MEGLSQAMASRPPLGHDPDHDFTFAENDGDDLRFHKSCLEEIDRYRRADEWLPSYHNILSRAALNSTRTLSKAGTIDTNPSHLIQYTRDGIADTLRLNAFSNLFDMGLGKTDAVLRWFIFALGTDPSPYFRHHAFQILGKFLGTLAIGQPTDSTPKGAQQQDGLIIEQESSSTDARKADLARRTTIAGALSALKNELQDNETLKQGLWTAITSPVLTLHEVKELLILCSLLYDPDTRMVLVLKYPRYWRCRKIGKGKLVFERTEKVRTKPMPRKIVPPTVPPPPALSIQQQQQTQTQQQPLQLTLPSPSVGIKREDSSPLVVGTPVSAMAPPRKLLFKPPRKPSLSSEGSEASKDTAAGTGLGPVEGEKGEKPKLKIKLKVGNAGARLGEGR